MVSTAGSNAHEQGVRNENSGGRRKKSQTEKPGKSTDDRAGIIRDDETYTVAAFMRKMEIGWSAYCTLVRDGMPVRTGSSRFGTIHGKQYNDWSATRPMKKRRRPKAKPA